MGKFNIFNESTWTPVLKEENIEATITRKALGSIGQLVGEMRLVKSKLQMFHEKEKEADFLIAQDLFNENPEAFKLMEVVIKYPDNLIGDVLRDIDFITTVWANKTEREKNWRGLLPAIKRLEPYLHNSNPTMYYDFKTEISGNAAWDVYCASQTRLAIVRKKFIFNLYQIDSQIC